MVIGINLILVWLKVEARAFLCFSKIDEGMQQLRGGIKN